MTNPYIKDFAFIFAVLLILIAWKFAIEGIVEGVAA
jgi:hypothetical protein